MQDVQMRSGMAGFSASSKGIAALTFTTLHLCTSTTAFQINGDTPWVVAGSNNVAASSVDEVILHSAPFSPATHPNHVCACPFILGENCLHSAIVPCGSSHKCGYPVQGDAVEPIEYQLALRDVQLDWYRVLGHPPAIQTYPLGVTDTVAVNASSAVLVGGGARPPPPPPYTGPVVYFGTLENAPWLTSFDLSACKLDSGVEAHCVIATTNGSIVATGNSTRGAIYALYEFAEKILGVDPWWRFTDNTPQYLGSIEVDPGFTSIVKPPAFVYRGVFTNDEDLLGYFRLDPAGESVFDLSTWNQIFETLLRAKCNMIIPGTCVREQASIAASH